MTEAKVSVVSMLITGVAFVGFGCWSLYDGWIKYPKIEETFQQYHQAGRGEEWIAYAAGRGWRKEFQRDSVTGAPYLFSDWDIRTQFIMAAACLPIGLIILIRLVWTLPRKLAADKEALCAVNRKRIPYSDIPPNATRERVTDMYVQAEVDEIRSYVAARKGLVDIKRGAPNYNALAGPLFITPQNIDMTWHIMAQLMSDEHGMTQKQLVDAANGGGDRRAV